jgi:hypothetical protein
MATDEKPTITKLNDGWARLLDVAMELAEDYAGLRDENERLNDDLLQARVFLAKACDYMPYNHTLEDEIRGWLRRRGVSGGEALAPFPGDAGGAETGL